MKVCTKCGCNKDETDFRWRIKRKNLRESACKPCRKPSGAALKIRYASAAQRRKRNREHLEIHPCLVCGESDPIVLEFDHRDSSTKHIEICEMSTRSLQTIAAEIAKCDVLCANCHRRRTAKQQGWYKNL